MALAPDTISSQPNKDTLAPSGKQKSAADIVRPMMNNPQGFMQLLGLMLLAFMKPEALEGKLENELAGLLGFDDKAAMDKWRDNAGGSFLKALGNTNWDRIDSDKVQQAYHKYSHLADSGNPLLELIGQHESAGDYNRAYGKGIVRPEINGKPVTESTLAEVRAWQNQYVRNGSESSAVGKYQIIRSTMDSVVEELAKEDRVSVEEFMNNNKFDAAMQDRMGTKLLERRGLDAYLSGNMHEKTFMRNLSQEWASLPKDASGKSFYAGDGLNRAGTDAESVLGSMAATRDWAGRKSSLTETFAGANAAETPMEPSSSAHLPDGVTGLFAQAASASDSSTTGQNSQPSSPAAKMAQVIVAAPAASI